MPPMWRAGELVNLPKAGSSSLFCCSDLASSRASLSFLNWHVSSSQPSWPWWSSFLSWNRACLDPLLKVSTSLFVCSLFLTCLFVQTVHDFGLFVCFWNLAWFDFRPTLIVLTCLRQQWSFSWIIWRLNASCAFRDGINKMQNYIFVVDVITRPSTCLKASRVQIMHTWFSRRDQEGKICIYGFQESM